LPAKTHQNHFGVLADAVIIVGKNNLKKKFAMCIAPIVENITHSKNTFAQMHLRRTPAPF
jgi:hypothetical protein